MTGQSSSSIWLGSPDPFKYYSDDAQAQTFSEILEFVLEPEILCFE